MKNVFIKLTYLLVLLVSPVVDAADSNGRKPVLDFETDVIEGEKRDPGIFLQFEAHAPTLEAVIFQRNNFNDLRSNRSRRRLRYVPSPDKESQ